MWLKMSILRLAGARWDDWWCELNRIEAPVAMRGLALMGDHRVAVGCTLPLFNMEFDCFSWRMSHSIHISRSPLPDINGLLSLLSKSPFTIKDDQVGGGDKV